MSDETTFPNDQLKFGFDSSSLDDIAQFLGYSNGGRQLTRDWPELKYCPTLADNYGDDDVEKMLSTFPDGHRKGWAVDASGRFILMVLCDLNYDFGDGFRQSEIGKMPSQTILYIYQRTRVVPIYKGTLPMFNWRVVFATKTLNWDLITRDKSACIVDLSAIPSECCMREGDEYKYGPHQSYPYTDNIRLMQYLAGRAKGVISVRVGRYGRFGEGGPDLFDAPIFAKERHKFFDRPGSTFSYGLYISVPWNSPGPTANLVKPTPNESMGM
jgi:hypothetical protein